MPKCKNIELAFDREGPTETLYNELLSNGVKKEALDRGASFYVRVDETSDYKELIVGKDDCRITGGEVWDEALSGKYCRIAEKTSELMPPSCLFNDLDPKTKFDEVLTKKINDAAVALRKELSSNGLKPKTPPFEKMLRLGLYYFTYVPDANWMNWKKNSAPDELNAMLSGLDNAGLPGFRTYLEEHGGLDVGRINDDYNERGPLKALKEWRAKCTDVADILNVVFKIGGIKSVHVWANGNSASTAASASEFVNTPPFITNMNHVFLMAGEGKDSQFYDLRGEQPSPDAYKGKDFDWQPFTDREFYAIRHLNMLWRNNSRETMERNCDMAQEMELGVSAKVQTLLMCSDFLLKSSYDNEADLLKVEEQMTEAIRLEPDNCSAYNNRGHVQALLKKYPEAVQSFKEAIRIDRYLLSSYSSYAQALVAAGLTDNALQIMLEGIEVARESARTPNWLTLAKIYLVREAYDKASDALDKAYEDSKGDSLFYLYRGFVDHSKGDLESTERNIAIAAALAGKNDAVAMAKLYNYYLEQKKDAEAFIVLKALFAADRSDENVASALCKEYSIRGEWRKVRETIEKFWEARGLSLIWNGSPVRKPALLSKSKNNIASSSSATWLFYVCAIWKEGKTGDAGELFDQLSIYFKQAATIQAIDGNVEIIEGFSAIIQQKEIWPFFVTKLIVPVYYDYIKRLSAAQNFAKAIEVGQKLLSHAPGPDIQDLDIWAELAKLYFKTGMFKDAANAYKTLGDLDIAQNRHYSLQVACGWLTSLWNAGEEIKPALDYLSVFVQIDFDERGAISAVLDGLNKLVGEFPEKLAQKDEVRKILYAIYAHLGNEADENGFTEEALRAFAKAREFN